MKQTNTGEAENLQSITSEQKKNSEDLDGISVASQILFVIVLYKMPLTDSLTFQSLEVAVHSFFPDYKIDLLICDNSPIPQFNVNELIENKCFNLYCLHDSSNPGISLSYNKAVELASIKNKKWILFLDHDTNLPSHALSQYVDALRLWPGYPLYAPQVLSDGILLSPCKYILYRGSHLKSIMAGVHKTTNRNVLNSGLLIDLKAYERVGGYDEQVWLYFSDFTFFNKIKRQYKDYVVIDCRVEHSLSSSDYSNYDLAMKRFKYYCEGAKAASELENNTLAYISYRLTVGLRSVKMTKRFKTINFFKIYLNTFFNRI